MVERDVIVCGNEAVAILQGVVTNKGAMQHVGPIVDHFTFDAENKIVSMRAFWKYA
jgi:steroid delta-isomerase